MSLNGGNIMSMPADTSDDGQDKRQPAAELRQDKDKDKAKTRQAAAGS